MREVLVQAVKRATLLASFSATGFAAPVMIGRVPVETPSSPVGEAGARYRRYRQDALWPAGRGKGRLESDEAGAPVACLLCLPDLRAADGAQCGCAPWKSDGVGVCPSGTLCLAGRVAARAVAFVAARRFRMGNRKNDAAGRGTPVAVSVQIAPNRMSFAAFGGAIPRAGVGVRRGRMARDRQ